MEDRNRQLADTCRELMRARFRNQITDEQHEYELAKLTGEFLDLYQPRYPEEKPVIMRRFESLTESDQMALGAQKLREMTEEYEKIKNAWRSKNGAVRVRNRENYEWLVKCMKVLRKRGHEVARPVEDLVNKFHDHFQRTR